MLDSTPPCDPLFLMGSGPVPTYPVRFGVFEADLSAGELRRNGVKVRLQDLPFRTLALLLVRPGEVITREEFRQALWPADVFVDFEQGISSAVMRLRDALRDSADNPVFIETIERRGYRWIGPIQPAPIQHALIQPALIQPGPFNPRPINPAPASEQPPTKAAIEPDPAPPTAPQPPSSLLWRKLVFALPLLLLIFAAWVFRAGNRSAAAGAKSVSASIKGPHSPANREAEDFYLKGRFYWNKRTPDSLNQAVDAFTQAIARDPNYADAYVGLADCYNLLREFSAMPASEAYFKAFAAAKKAVELDPQSADAHASLAFVTFWGMWDAQDAEKEFRRAIELDPGNAKAHHWFATYLHARGRHDQALTEIGLARKLDPHSPSILADNGELLWAAGRHDQALQVLTQLEAAEPDFVSPHRYLQFAYFDTGDYPHYIAELKKVALLTHNAAQLSEAEAAAKGFAEGGEHGLHQAQLAERMKLYGQGKLSPYFVAQSDARLGKTSDAIKYLALCVQSHDELSMNITQDQSFSVLHSDPAFSQLIAIVGLPPVR
jgi:DNA-binding winged helix-turn-helix (wHTH) protein/tetratricopeptide (TPR) repeat protein